MFVVYLTHYTGKRLPEWYIGSSSEERVQSGYNGSVTSQKWFDIYSYEQVHNKKLFKTRILSYHHTRDDAVTEELRLQKMHLVVPSTKYINESYATKNGCFTRDKSGKLNPMFGLGNKITGNRNGRHRDNFKGNIEKVGENISKALKKSQKNKKGNNAASKKYYAHDSISNTYTDIDKGYLRNFCECFNIKYITLYNTLSTKKTYC